MDKLKASQMSTSAPIVSALFLVASLSACGSFGSAGSEEPDDTDSPLSTPTSSPTPTAAPSTQTPISSPTPTPAPSIQPSTPTPTSPPATSTPTPSSKIAADVTKVTATGSPGSYTLYVTLASPDTGCTQYADWWEVLGEDGSLIYRRVLGHSHVDEQPFTRSGGPVGIQGDDVVIVRGHMNAAGYGGAALRGSVNAGFADAPDITASFHPEVSSSEPLPSSCAF